MAVSSFQEIVVVWNRPRILFGDGCPPMFERWIFVIGLCFSGHRIACSKPRAVDLSFLNANKCVAVQSVFHNSRNSDYEGETISRCTRFLVQ